MPLSPAELAANIVVTKAFINTRPVALTLIPTVLVPDGSGGKRATLGVPRSPQVFRFIESPSLRMDVRDTELGDQKREDDILLGMPDAEMEVGDVFDYDGDRWTITEFAFDIEYEKRATVIRYGR